MNNKKTERHFPYIHPRFSKGPAEWERSVYYWWWAFLKRNEDYLRLCDNDGKGGSERMAEVYSDFGDIRGDSFEAWWKDGERGAELFAQQPVEKTGTVLKEGATVPDESKYIVICLPAHLPKYYLNMRCQQLIKDVHKGKRGHQLAKGGDAKYRVTGQPNIEALRRTLKAYDMRMAKPESKLWEIGNELIPSKIHRITKEHKRHEVADKKNILNSYASRLVRKAHKYVEATGEGRFL